MMSITADERPEPIGRDAYAMAGAGSVMDSYPESLRDAIRAAVAARGPGRTVCPSEIARAVSPDGWRPLMPAIRTAAAGLARKGRIEVTRGGRTVDVLAGGGPVRFGLPAGQSTDVTRRDPPYCSD